MSSITIVKLGGSAVTDKSKICMPRLDVIHRAAGEIASYSNNLVLLHGGGSFAHPFATKKLMSSGFKGAKQLERVSEIEMNLDQLTRIVGVALLLRNCPFVPIHPMNFITLRNGRVRGLFLQPIILALKRGIMPLINGDMAFDEKRGFVVVSADRIASLLGEKLSVSKVLFGCDVDGVYHSALHQSKGSPVIREVNRTNYARVLKGLKGSTIDASGGMEGKVREALKLARLGVESCIFNLTTPGNLTQLLEDDSGVGTRFVAWK